MNLLFIAPIFFDYEKAIIIELQKQFPKVVFRCEIPFNSPTKYYALKRLVPKFAQKALQKYNTQLIKLLEDEKIEKVFVIRGYGLLPEFLEFVKLKGIELINYQWDSLQNNPNGLLISQYTNKNFSFDRVDCERFSHFTHIPLFYIWDNAFKRQSSGMFDVMFVGSYHSDRQIITKKMEEICKVNGLKMITYIYHPWGSFVRKKILGEKISWKDVKFKRLSRQNYYKLLCASRVVLDIQSPTQTGATIRTIEALSLGKKLISTNKELVKENFYSDTNIFIWDGKSDFHVRLLVDSNFDHTCDDAILNIQNWIEKIFIG